MENRFYVQQEKDTLAPIIAAVPKVVKGAVTLVKKIGPILKEIENIGKKFGLGKIAEGFNRQKAAAAINALRAIGYSEEQIQSIPLRLVVDSYAEFGMTIETSVKTAPSKIAKILGDMSIKVTPLGNPSPYRKPANAEVQSIVESIYGPNFPKYPTKITKAVLDQFPPFEPEASTPASQASTLINNSESATSTVKIPESTLYTPLPEDLLLPFVPAMQNTLLNAGIVIPANHSLSELATVFYEKIVFPATHASLDSIDKSIVESILEFMGKVAVRKENGEELPPILDKLGTFVLKAEDKLKNEGKKQVGSSIGQWIVDNPLIVGGIALGIIVLIVVIARRK